MLKVVSLLLLQVAVVSLTWAKSAPVLQKRRLCMQAVNQFSLVAFFDLRVLGNPWP